MTISIGNRNDAKIIGGGLQSAPSWYATKSYPIDTHNWFVQSRPVVADQSPIEVIGFAVVLYDPLNKYDVQYYSSSAVGAGQPQGSASVTVPSPYVLVGGGFSTDEFIAGSHPSNTAWTADFTVSPLSGFSEDGVIAYAVGLKANDGSTIQNHISSSTQQASSVGQTIGSYAQASSNYRTTGGGMIVVNSIVSSTYPFSWNVWYGAVNSYALPALELVYNVAVSVTPAQSSTPTQQQCHGVSLVQTQQNSWNGGSQWGVNIVNSNSQALTRVILCTSKSLLIFSIWQVSMV
eukprot:TRINITY_DN2750_c0_g1_i2.p1 TRINITY_DN2750_c0_g1~~TRINITY_DN2750_c0_g1_i2.p1  ORF type:complete len:291 (-),score=56.02 TRINITY_DN2750_c0_g1_i2:418-1290(-)